MPRPTDLGQGVLPALSESMSHYVHSLLKIRFELSLDAKISQIRAAQPPPSPGRAAGRAAERPLAAPAGKAPAGLLDRPPPPGNSAQSEPHAGGGSSGEKGEERLRQTLLFGSFFNGLHAILP